MRLALLAFVGPLRERAPSRTRSRSRSRQSFVTGGGGIIRAIFAEMPPLTTLIAARMPLMPGKAIGPLLLLGNRWRNTRWSTLSVEGMISRIVEFLSPIPKLTLMLDEAGLKSEKRLIDYRNIIPCEE